MRHIVSAHQLVLWPRHVLTEAPAATGIVHPPQTDESPRGAATMTTPARAVEPG